MLFSRHPIMFTTALMLLVFSGTLLNHAPAHAQKKYKVVSFSPAAKELPVGFLARGIFGLVANEIDPVPARWIFQWPGAEVRPAVADDIGIVPIAKAICLHPVLELGLNLGVEDVEEQDVIFTPIIRNGNEMVPALDERHVGAELFRATVTVGIEAQRLAGLGNLGEIDLHPGVVQVRDAVCEKRLAVRGCQPMPTIDLRKRNGLGRRRLGRMKPKGAR